MENRIIIVSNRLPFSVKEKEGKWKLEKIVSGLVSGLEDLKNKRNSVWLGWDKVDGIPNEVSKEISLELEKEHFINISLTKEIIKYGYDGFCKKELWGIFHNFINHSRFIEKEWNNFVKMNQYFADEIIKNYKKNDIIYVHDFQLMLIPQMLKEYDENIKVGFFLHIPFPNIELFKLIPTYKSFLLSLSKADYVGFHTELFAKNYKELCIEENLSTDNIHINPIGVDFDKLKSDNEEVFKIREAIGTKIILGSERSDFPKGIVERLLAYNLLLEKYPDIREKVTLLQIAVGATKSSESFEQIGKEIQLLISEINGKYSTISWNPIKFINRGFNQEDLFNLYSASDICSVNSLADGLNLVSMEYCAVNSPIERDLILSKFAGSSEILKDAYIINPRDIDNLANIFYKLLKKSTNNTMKLQKQVEKYTIERWIDNFLNKI